MISIRKCILATSILPVVLSFYATADEVILDDLIIAGDGESGSLCVGQGCAEGEIFEFDSIKLKSPAPMIRFVDTSSSAAFPSQDWIMGVVDGMSNTSILYIKDAEAGTNVLQLSSSAGGGVALGAGAVLEDNVISVGDTAAERRIIHVADGVNPTDAVNVGQVEEQLADIQDAIDGVNSRIDDLLDLVESL